MKKASGKVKESELVEKFEGVFEFINTYLVMRSKLAKNKRIGIRAKCGDKLVNIVEDYIQMIDDCNELTVIETGNDAETVAKLVRERGITLVMTTENSAIDGLPEEMTCFTPAHDACSYDVYRPLFFWSRQQIGMYRSKFLKHS